jgi:RHS repeat-associated protein
MTKNKTPSQFYSTTYSTTLTNDGSYDITNIFPGNLATTGDLGKDGGRVVNYPDGSRTFTWKGPDPRYGMQAPIIRRLIKQTPAQITADPDPTEEWDEDPDADRYEVISSLEASYNDPADPSRWTELTRTQTVVANGRSVQSVFDRDSLTWTTTSAANRTTTTTVDEHNRITSIQVDGLYPVQYEYDGHGRLWKITHGIVGSTDPPPRVWTFNYGSDGYLESMENPLEAAGQLPSLDPEGPLNLLLAGRTYYDVRDGSGRVTELTQPGGDQVSFGYDGNGNVTSVTPPGRPAHDFDYTEVNLLASYDPPPLAGSDFANSDYSYLWDRQLEAVTHEVQGQLETAIDVTYNDEGRPQLIDVKSGSGSNQSTFRYDIKYQYEVAGQDGVSPHTIDVTGGGRLEYVYDGFLLQSTEWKPSPAEPTGTGVNGLVSRTYNRDYRVATRTVTADGDSWTIDFTYADPDGLLTGASHATAGGITLLRDDPNHGLITGTTMTIGSQTLATTRVRSLFAEVDTYTATLSGATVFSEEILLRDALGRIMIKAEEIDGGNRNVYRYRYDEVGRLTHVWDWDESSQPPQAGTLLEHYEYRDNGNRISANAVGLAFGSGPGTVPVNLLDTEILYDDQDRLLWYGSTEYGWTPDGRLASKTVHVDPSDPSTDEITTYTYDVLGNLRRVELPGMNIDYIIDARNRRIGKKIGGNLVQGFLYKDGLNPIAELDASGQIVSRFVYASRAHVPDFMIKPDPVNGDKVYRLISDHLGSVRLVVDMSTGTTVQRLDYDAFGRVACDPCPEPPGFQPFGFAGGLYDADTGLIRFGARDYEPETGRWASKDPAGFAGRDTNLYRYAQGDPVNFVDPSGEVVIVLVAVPVAISIGQALILTAITVAFVAMVAETYDISKQMEEDIVELTCEPIGAPIPIPASKLVECVLIGSGGVPGKMRRCTYLCPGYGQVEVQRFNECPPTILQSF